MQLRIAAIGPLLLLVACTSAEPLGPAGQGDASSASSGIAVSSRADGASVDSAVTMPTSSAASSVAQRTDQTPYAGGPPRSVALDVPFAPQAPFANWDMPYQEACEEASLILVHRFLQGEGITLAEMDREILDVVAWQEQNGMPPDVDMADLARTAREYYGHEAEVRYDITIDDIVAALADGHPVIVPLAGRDVGNPYYSGEGPWYHALVITGYDPTHFITNDVGTKRGAGYRYRKQVLFDAIHDWTGVKEEIRGGRKAMLVVR